MLYGENGRRKSGVPDEQCSRMFELVEMGISQGSETERKKRLVLLEKLLQFASADLLERDIVDALREFVQGETERLLEEIEHPAKH